MRSKGMVSVAVVFVTVGVALFLAAPAAQASVLYWDNTGSGCWDTSSDWATDTNGDDIGTWVPGDDANFYDNSSGTVSISNSALVGNVAFDGTGYIVTGGSLDVTGTITDLQNATINSVLIGSSGLTKAGAASLTLGGVDTYSGTTTVNGGTLYLTGSAGGTILNSTAIAVNYGGTFYVNQTGGSLARATTTTPVTLSGGTFSFLGNVSHTGTDTEQFGALTLGPGQSTVTLSRGAATTNHAMLVFGSSTTMLSDLVRTAMSGAMVDFTATVAGQGGPGGTYYSTGYGIPSAPNDFMYFGSTTLGSGPASSYGLCDWVVVNGHDFCRFSGSNGIHEQDAGSGGTSPCTLSNNINETAASGYIIVTSSVGQTVTANESINSLTEQSLTTAITTSLNGFKVNIEQTSEGGGSPLDHNGGICVSGSAPFTPNAGYTITGGTITSGVSGTNSELFVWIDSNTTTINSVIQDIGGGATTLLSKCGSGTLVLGGANTYSHGTTLNGGVLDFANGTLPFSTSSPNLIYFYGGTLQWATNNTQDVSGGIAPIASGQAAIIDTNGNSVTFGTGLSGAGGLTKLSSGTLTLSVSNSYTGPTAINGGVLSFAASALPFSTSTPNIYFNGGALQWGTSNTQDVSAGIAPISSGQAAIIDTNGNSVTFATGLSGAGGLTKLGASVLTLSANNTYTGATTIGNGTLSVTGTIGAASAVSVGDQVAGYTGVLAGNGLVGGAVTVLGPGVSGNGGHVAPGVNSSGNFGAIGTLAVGSFSVNSGAALDFDLNTPGSTVAPGTDCDLVASSGAVTLNSFTLNISAGSNFSNGVYRIVTYGSLPSFNASVLGTGTVPGGYIYGLVNNTGSSEIDLYVYAQGSSKTWTGTNNTTWDTATPNWIVTGVPGTPVVYNNANPTTLVYADSVTFDDSAGTGAVSVTGTVSPSSFTVSNTNLAYSFSGSGAIAGVTGLVKSGTGTLAISMTGNTYTGGTTLAAGLLQIGASSIVSGGTLASGPLGLGALTISGCTLQDDGNGQTLANAVNINGDVTLSSSGAAGLTLAPQGLNTANVVTLANAPVLTVTAPTTIADQIVGSTGLNKAGSDILTLTAAVNSYTGPTTVSGGTLEGTAANIPTAVALSNGANVTFNQVSSGTLSNAVTGTGSFTKAGGGALVLTANNNYSGATTISDGTLQIGAGGGAGSINGTSAVANEGVLAFNRSDTVTFTASISGGGNVTMVGPGTLILGGANTYGGGTTVNGGLLEFASASANPGGIGSIIINSGGAVAVGGAYTTVTGWLGSSNIASISSGALALIGNSSETINMNDYSAYATISFGASGAATYNGAFTPTGNTYNLGGGGGTLTFASALTDDDTNALVVNGPGTVILTNTGNAYSGGTTISSGTLQLGDGATAFGAVPGNITNYGMLTFANPTAQTFGGVVSGSGNVTMLGPGKLTLGSVNTYSGTTTVNGGTLYLTGTGAAAGKILDSTAIVVNNGGTFYMDQTGGTLARVGNGTPVTVSGGTFSYLGNVSYTGTETEYFGALTLGPGQSVVTVSRGASTNDVAMISFGSNTSSLGSDLVRTPMSGAMVDFTATIPGQGGPGGTYSSATYGNPTAPGDHIYFGSPSLSGGPASNNDPADWIIVNGHDFARFSGSQGIHEEDTATTITFSASVTAGSNATVIITTTGTQSLTAGVTDNSLTVQCSSAVATNLTGYTLNLENNGAGSGSSLDKNGGICISGSAPFTPNGGYTMNGGTITSGVAGTNSELFVWIDSNTTTINSVIKDIGGGATTLLSKNGSGTLVLGGANTYSYGTTLNGGVLNFSNGTLPFSTSAPTSISTAAPCSGPPTIPRTCPPALPPSPAATRPSSTPTATPSPSAPGCPAPAA